MSLEKVISRKPDAYIMPGSKRGNSQVLPLGLQADPQEVNRQAERLLSRTGVSNIPTIEAKRAYGIYHHFYNHPWNIVGMAYLAKDIYPQTFSDLNPDDSWHYIVRHFTTLPDLPFVFSWQQGE